MSAEHPSARCGFSLFNATETQSDHRENYSLRLCSFAPLREIFCAEISQSHIALPAVVFLYSMPPDSYREKHRNTE